MSNRERMDFAGKELEDAIAYMATPNNIQTGNVIATYKFGNTKVMIRDTYINKEKNIPILETIIGNMYGATCKIIEVST